MGHEYCSSRFHSQNHHHNNHKYHHGSATIFLPMLCSRPSIINDAIHGLPRPCTLHQTKPKPKPKPKPNSDPLSPKISCIGQVKRKSKVVVFPNPNKPLSNNHHHSHSHRTSPSTVVTNNHHHGIINGNSVAKLVKFFSSKSLTAGAVGVAGDEGRGHAAVEEARGCCGCECKSGNCGGVISVAELDPPLPVVKRRPIKAQQGTESESESESESQSLWKRRSGGATLRGLQIQQFHHPRHHLQPTTV